MTSIRNLFLCFFFFAALAACQQPGSNQSATAEAAETATNTEAASEAPQAEKVISLSARFVEFTLGDAAHFVFEDKTGKSWDFGGCDDDSVEFAQELPAEKTDHTNQGWTSNAALQNKWFDLKYVIRQQPLYIDGPVGDVLVIIEAKMVQE